MIKSAKATNLSQVPSRIGGLRFRTTVRSKVPDDGQPWADGAKAALIQMIGGRKVRIEEYREDRYGRLVAMIYVDDKHRSNWVNVNAKMVVKGHVWLVGKHYDHFPTDTEDKLNRLEEWAKIKQVGRTRSEKLTRVRGLLEVGGETGPS